MGIDAKACILRLGRTAIRALETGTEIAMEASHREVTIAHLLRGCLDHETDIKVLLQRRGLYGNARRVVDLQLSQLPKRTSARPILAHSLLELVSTADELSAASYPDPKNRPKLRTGQLLALLMDRAEAFGCAGFVASLDVNGPWRIEVEGLAFLPCEADVTQGIRAPVESAPPPRAPKEPTAGSANPDVERIARRALCLGAVCQQAMYERSLASVHTDDLDLADDEDEPELERSDRPVLRAARLHRWVVLERLSSDLSPSEKATIEREPCQWDEESVNAAAWKMEALGMLLWAVGLVDRVPPYDKAFDEELLMDVYTDLLRGVAEPRLRAPFSIDGELERAGAWHTRCSSTLRMNVEPSRDDAPPKKGDMSLFGKPFHELDESELVPTKRRVRERLAACAWLRGDESALDERRQE